MRNVKKAKHGPTGPLSAETPPNDVESEGESEEEEEEVEEGMEGEMEGDNEEDDGSMSIEEECDPEALKYIKLFKMEVVEDPREACEAKGLDMAKDLSAGAPQRFLEWAISPIKLDRFQGEFWEKKPFLVRRPKNRNYYAGIFDKATIEKLLEEHELKYGLNIDVTKYDIDGGRSTFSSEGSATPSKVWSKYADGWSVRILHPQRWCDPVFLILSAFERFWGSVAGCNAYLTPAGSQGFSPHYDDIEAFVIQTEGRKRWKVYKPRTPGEALPRFSSPNFEQGEIGEPILDVDLEPGDILYMPRGTIHQAKASEDAHSLHITVSVGQRNCWGDFLEFAMPRALELASEDHILLRESLPRGYADYMGVAHSDDHDNPQRAAFIDKIMECMAIVSQSIPWDSAADQLAVKFLQSRLPLPAPANAVHGKGQKITGKSRVRLVAPDVARLVLEGDSAQVLEVLKEVVLPLIEALCCRHRKYCHWIFQCIEMVKKKFIDKKKAATFVLMHRDTEDADDDVSARVFTRVDAGFGQVPGFSEEDPRTNPDYGYETDDGEEDEGAAVEESSVFADAEEEGGVDCDVKSVRSSRSIVSRSTRRSVSSRAAHKGPLPEHIRLELVELGFPDDGYDYMQHMRKIGVSGVGGSFVPAARPKPEKLRADVKVFDSSKVPVQLVEEASAKKIIEVVGSSTHRVKRPAYVENGLDPEVAALLDDSEGSEFDSLEELEDDFIVFANNLPEGSTSQEFQAPENATFKKMGFDFQESFPEGDEEEEEFSDEDEGARSAVTIEHNRPSRILDEQFEQLALREYDDDDDNFDDDDSEVRGHADLSQFDDVLSEFLSDPKVFGDKYMTPAEIRRAAASTSASKPAENGQVLEAEKKKKIDSAINNVVDYSEDDELVVIEVESEDDRSNWDCETVVSTLSNLDNHPGKIAAPSKPRRKAPTLGKVLEDKEATGGIIKLRGKASLPTDFLPLRPQAEKAKQLKSLGKDSCKKPQPVSRAGETPEERKARKAAVKEERREARAAKKALKVLYKDESQRAQHGAAHTGPSGIHLP